MINVNELKQLENTAFRLVGNDAEVVSLEFLMNLFQTRNDEVYGLPIRIEYDQIKSGGFFNSHVEDCLTIVNKDHEYDYFKYCITLSKQGRVAFVELKYYGQSILTQKKNKEEERRGSIGGMLLNALGGVNESEYNAEYQYYDMLETLYNEILS